MRPANGDRVVLLGPQRFRPTVADALRSLDVGGSIATVTAGWQEREPDDAELDELLEGRTVNLGLHARWLDVTERDREFAAADRQRRDRLEELQSVYLLRLHHAIEAVYELQRRIGDPEIARVALEDAVGAVRALDAGHLARVAEVHAAFHEAWPPHERPVIAAHRAEVAQRIGDADAVAIAGGHVGVLLSCLHLFNVGPALGQRPVVAWSAGAMAVSETVVLFHDLALHSPGHAEVYDHGLALCRGVVPLPHARRRLRIDDRRRMAVLARRFAPARCVVLDDGARLDCRDDVGEPATVVVRDDGRLTAAVA
jgi:hypothetical protein